MYFDAVAVVDGEGKHSPEGARALTGLAGLTQGPLGNSSKYDHSSGTTRPTARMTHFLKPPSVTGWSAEAAAAWASLVAKGKPYGST